jgi:hypothetical protein
MGLLALLAIVAAVLVWREATHRSILVGRAAQEAALQQQLENVQASWQSEQEQRLGLAGTVDDQLITIQSLEDRATNLEAQRDHLRVEVERLAALGHKTETANKELMTQLEDVRHDLLQAGARPQGLENSLAAALSRIEALEQRIDEQATLLRHLPGRLEVDALSSDGLAFSLKGETAALPELPAPVYVCGAGGIYLEGWAHRLEGEILIGHAERWRVDTSTLVKGEKVFILPRNTYEADHH